ncbi:MAG: hypothetical protein HZA79_06410 [Sphingobacteriales bacterium]|nr:hypothetical protein [Sphingobacteriales bacterium]
MKRKTITTFTVLSGLLLTAFTFADDIIKKLGMEHSNAQYYILGNLLGNFSSGEMEEDNGSGENESVYQQAESFKLPYARLLPSVISGDKAGAAKELCAYIKQYVNSQDFADAYNKRRESAKPGSEPWRPDAETIQSQKKSLKQQEAQLAQYKKNKQLPASTLDAMEKSLVSQKKQLAQWEDPHPNQTRWEKNYPADPTPIVRSKLQEYLALVATVDFTAQLTEPDKYKIKKFINPLYEKKSLKWKACYRAGKEVNEVVTAFVKEWLKGEIITSVKEKMPDYKNAGAGSPASNTPDTPVTTGSADSKTDPAAKPVKEKKSLLNKLKKVTGF